MMVLVFGQKKRSKMGEDGCGWMRMGGMGSILTGGNKNRAKRVTHARARRVFGCMPTDKNSSKLTKMVVVFCHHHVEQEGGNNGCAAQK